MKSNKEPLKTAYRSSREEHNVRLQPIGIMSYRLVTLFGNVQPESFQQVSMLRKNKFKCRGFVKQKIWNILKKIIAHYELITTRRRLHVIN